MGGRLSLLVATWVVLSFFAADSRAADDFAYFEKTARGEWRPMTGSLDVAVVQKAGREALRMPCNFIGAKIDRASWDLNIQLDLTMCKGVEFLFYCADPMPVSGFIMYFRSGAGWYSCPFDPPVTKGWHRVRVPKNAAGVEGNPAGWAKVDTIRLSAWRGRNADTEFFLSDLRMFGADAKIVVVLGDSAADGAPGEKESVRKFTDVMSGYLERAGFSFLVVSDRDLTAEKLKNRKIVILPYNPKMPEKVAEAVGAFLEAGGKLIASYTLPKALETAAGVRIGSHVQEPYRGFFSSIRPSRDSIEGLPAITNQSSWNIHEVSFPQGRGRIGAWWHNEKGESTEKPALAIGDRCLLLTHVLTEEDPENKTQFVSALVGHFGKDLWREAAEKRVDSTGRLEPYNDFEAAERGISKIAAGNGPSLEALSQSRIYRKQSRTLLEKGNLAEAIVVADKSRRTLVEANVLAQKPLRGEHRAFWCHSAFGVKDMEWDQAVRLLSENGFTAILPNMLWGGVAYYRSDILPVAKEVEERGDQIELCLAACKKYGVECHVWKVNFNMGGRTEKPFVDEMKKQGRTQLNFDGSPADRWLCPSHPENQKLEIDAMLEVARKYDVHGVHFDYIRYPGRDGCYCKGCRERFEKSIGERVENWPRDARDIEKLSEKWLEFRRTQITTVVAGVSKGVKKIRPAVQVSAAVFRDWPVDRDSVGQDWKLWCERGYMDFVCPMDYTDSSAQFQRMIERQLEWAGKTPCYPGIGLSVWPDRTDVSKLIEQIAITRRLGTKGFTIFNYSDVEARDVLPRLGKGITRKK